MIANPAISAGWFPGSDTGYQGVRRVVQDRLLKIARNYGPVGWPSPGGAVMSLGILLSGVVLFIMDKMKMILAPWYFIVALMVSLIYFSLYAHLYMNVS